MADYQLSVSMVGTEQLQKALAQTSAFAHNELAKALNKTALTARELAVQKAPHNTGALWNSLHVENASSSKLVAKVGTNLNYALYQEQGTGVYGPHGQAFTITARNGKALSWKGAAHPVKSVTIQGTRPKWFMKQARDDVKPKFTTYLQQAASAIVNQVAGAAR